MATRDLSFIDVNLAIDARERADSHGETADRMCAPDPEYPLGLFRYEDADSIEYALDSNGEPMRVPRTSPTSSDSEDTDHA